MSDIELQELNEASEKNTIYSFVSQNRVSKQRLQARLGRVDLLPQRCGCGRCLVLFRTANATGTTIGTATATGSGTATVFATAAATGTAGVSFCIITATQRRLRPIPMRKALIGRRTVLGCDGQIAIAARNAGAPAVRPPLFVQ